MSNSYTTRRDPMPLSRGGEVAFVVIAAVLGALGAAALAGLGVASALFGGGWVWPHGTATIGRVLAGLLSGRPGRGLPRRAADRVPGSVAVYGCVAVAELVLLAVVIAAWVLVARYRRPGGTRAGMASRWQASDALGAGRLRAAADLIRPDLRAPNRRTAPAAESEQNQ